MSLKDYLLIETIHSLSNYFSSRKSWIHDFFDYFLKLPGVKKVMLLIFTRYNVKQM